MANGAGPKKGARVSATKERAKARAKNVADKVAEKVADLALTGELTTSEEMAFRRERFIHEYLVDGNGTAAAIRSGVEEVSARVAAYRWLHTPEVRQKIAELREKDAQLANIQRARLLAEQLRLATSNVVDLFDPDTGRPLAPHELPREVAACVQQVELTHEEVLDEDEVPVRVVKVKYRMHPKAGALDSLFKHLGMYEADNRQAGESLGQALTGEARLTDVARRLAYVLNTAASRKPSG